MKKIIAIASALSAAAITVVWAAPEESKNPPAQTVEQAKLTGPAVNVDLGPVHNGFRLGKKIISGSCPYGEAGFKALAQQGVKTVISVDGARPDEKLARKFGMRYVHIPVAYGGITRAQSLSIARAVRDLQGPVFIHCHHGKHRGPTAAVLAAMVTEGWTTEQAQAAMKQAGTSTHYTGLWAAARQWKAPTPEELELADASFPSVAVVPATAAAMVTIDERWEHIGEVREAGWKAPPSHPDIDPAHEALLLREDFRELARSPETAKFPTDYLQKLNQAETAAAALEAALRGEDIPKAQQAFAIVAASCKSCHDVYRDVDRLKSESK